MDVVEPACIILVLLKPRTLGLGLSRRGRTCRLPTVTVGIPPQPRCNQAASLFPRTPVPMYQPAFLSHRLPIAKVLKRGEAVLCHAMWWEDRKSDELGLQGVKCVEMWGTEKNVDRVWRTVTDDGVLFTPFLNQVYNYNWLQFCMNCCLQT
jgi:hypothetical protein